MTGLPAPLADSLELAHTISGAVLETLTLAIELVCAGVIALAVFSGVAELARARLVRADRPPPLSSVAGERVGHRLLFALELLVAADIIDTMRQPSFEQLATLAGVSAIRIATGIALTRELRPRHAASAPEAPAEPTQ
ncbi:MAG: DUF1622 domain-containing protein [Phycisphaerales bacterium]